MDDGNLRLLFDARLPLNSCWYETRILKFVGTNQTFEFHLNRYRILRDWQPYLLGPNKLAQQELCVQMVMFATMLLLLVSNIDSNVLWKKIRFFTINLLTVISKYCHVNTVIKSEIDTNTVQY